MPSANEVHLLTEAEARAAALQSLLRYLGEIGYCFVTSTPASHQRVLARDPGRIGKSPQEVLGWSLPFASGEIDPAIESLLADAGALSRERRGLLRSTVRVSLVGGHRFLHSAFPTTAADAVFLGPDTYRFVQLIRSELRLSPIGPGSVIVDIGTGSGAGAVIAADLCPSATTIMTDLNPRALSLAAINARSAGHEICALEGRNLAGLEDGVDLALANPPYIIDPAGRVYRDGGGMRGAAISVEMTEQALAALRPGGRLILYTGSAIVAGADELHRALLDMVASCGMELRYWEIDPDVFGEELDNIEYGDVDRIAAVAAVITRRSSRRNRSKS